MLIMIVRGCRHGDQASSFWVVQMMVFSLLLNGKKIKSFFSCLFIIFAYIFFTFTLFRSFYTKQKYSLHRRPNVVFYGQLAKSLCEPRFLQHNNVNILLKTDYKHARLLLKKYRTKCAAGFGIFDIVLIVNNHMISLLQIYSD